MKHSYIVLLCAFLSSALTLCDATCDKVIDFGLSQEDINFIVGEHNKLRSAVSEGLVPGQVKGKGFKVIKYDETLAEKAQEIANTCEPEVHHEVVDGRWPNVMQTWALHRSTGFHNKPEWLNVTTDWSEQYKYYKYGGPINSKNSQYTQMVWADTEFIGCGYTFFETDKYYQYQKLYVCNYGPGGNNDEYPYVAA